MHQSKKELNLKLWNQLMFFDFRDQLAQDEIMANHQVSRGIESLSSSAHRSDELRKR